MNSSEECFWEHWDNHDPIARCDECWRQWVKLSFEDRVRIMDEYETARRALSDAS